MSVPQIMTGLVAEANDAIRWGIQQKAVADGNEDKSTRRCLTAAEAVKYNVANAQ